MRVLEVDLAVVSKMEETDGSNHGNTFTELQVASRNAAFLLPHLYL